MRSAAPIQPAASSARFEVQPGETVTAWALSPITAIYYPGETALAEDRVNYRFINGFVDVGDLPCRIAIWNDIKTRTVSLERDWTVESVNLPGFNRRLEFSGFWHRPTRLKRWCRTTLIAPCDGDYAFTLATCGGVHIWVGDRLATRFEPYTRNSEKLAEIALTLSAGANDIVMLCEDMAERDTNWFVEMTLRGDQALIAEIPGAADAAVIGELMALAQDVRPAAEFFTNGPLILEIDQPSQGDVLVSAKVLPSVHMRDKPPLLAESAVLPAGATRLSLDGIDTMPDGYHALDLVFAVGDTRVYRQIAFALLREKAPAQRDTDIKARKTAALAFAADHGEMRIGRALAMLALGRTFDPLLERIIEDTITNVNERRDCSDFVMVPLLWVYGAYGERLPSELVERLRAAILDYRYWVDEPGNDAMWFWSENHVLCFHVSQYLAGKLLPDARFTASGRNGDQQLALAQDRLGRWLDSVEGHGLAEWNSAAYYPIDFIGLLALAHWADGDIADRSKALLDRLFKMIALHTLAGVPAGSMGRAYDKELRAGPLTELAPISTVAFGEGWFNDGVAALTMFCAGDYEPPAKLVELVLPKEAEALTAHYVQGYDTAARLALYKTAHVQLSASVDGEPGKKGHQQHIMDIRFAGNPFARAWINHPGEDDPWGHRRPSYWAGNGVMPRVGLYQNAALMLYDIDADHRIDFTHIYAPRETFEESAILGDWIVLRSGRGFAALSPCGPLEAVATGPGRHREFRAYGRRAAWAAIVGDLAEGAGLAEVGSMLEATTVTFDRPTMSVTLRRPDAPVLTLNYAEGLRVDGDLHAFPNPSIEPRVTSAPAFRLRSNRLS